jgi:uncharacterized protein YprB with RNaseH-like and TPR domain
LPSGTEPMYRHVLVSLRSKLDRLTSIGPSAGGSSFNNGGLVEATAPAVSAPVPLPATLADLRARIQATLERTTQKLRPPPPVDTVELPFVTEATPRGPRHTRSQRLSAAHRTGRASVSPARDASAELLALLALDPALAGCDPRRALYLDTETTGLSGGAGTVAFLVGLAFWDEAGLVLEQVLVRALGEEGPMLERVRERVEAASMVVTFNGKSFDMPLLRTRFVMAGMAPPAEPPHLDLLHVARRVHGKRGGCRLVALESEILGFERVDDVASGDVSECYLHFLRTGHARALLGVIEHNAWDVVAMVALLGLYGEPLHDALRAEDLPGVARTLRRAGALDRAYAIADTAVLRGCSADALRARAEIAKARGDRTRALADFEALTALVDDPAARLELAKLYEHWVKAPSKALQWVEQGTGEGEERTNRRKKRLARKADR